MTGGGPLSTVEVRWFFGRDDRRYDAVRRWFESARMDGQSAPPRPLPWSERTDVYLLMPRADDMGVKWREGQLQFKGRVASLGALTFAARHAGVVERWVKWSYAELPTAYRSLFGDGDETGSGTMRVRKRRVLRKLRLDVSTGTAVEVAVDEYPATGMGIEFTDLEVRGRLYGTLGFEAHPDDEAIRSALAHTVERSLRGLDTVRLTAEQSMSYPAWLATLRPR